MTVQMTRRALALMALLLAFPPPATAQLNPFRSRTRGLELSSGDYEMAGDAVARLNQNKAAQPGQQESWENPATGAKGTATLLRHFTSQGMACNQIRNDIQNFAGRTGSYELNWCKTADGRWRVRD
jgi:hypothetical protein